jgi:hypothetical protein
MAPVTSASGDLAASGTESAPAHLAQSVRRYFARLRVAQKYGCSSDGELAPAACGPLFSGLRNSAGQAKSGAD